MKKFIVSFLLASFLLSNSVYAEEKEIQLTDYRYSDIENGLYGYNFCNVKYKLFDKVYYNSVILNPDGTELLSEGNKRICVSIRGAFPQYEKMFAYLEYNKNSEEFDIKIIDGKNNELYQHPTDLRTGIIFIDDELALLGVSIYYHSLLEVPYVRSASGVFNLKTGALITPKEKINKEGQPISWTEHFEMSEDKEYFSFGGRSEGKGRREGMAGMFDYDLHSCTFMADGTDITGRRPEGLEMDNVYYDYLDIDYENQCFVSDKIDTSYISKTKQIGGKDYAALFKVLSEDETEADYIPTESPSFWAGESIKKATDDGLLYNNAKCRYKDSITRLDFCVLAVEAFCKSQGLEADEYIEKNNISLNFKKFDDTDNAYVLLANELGIVSGTAEDAFSPYENITRQQAAVMLSNMAKLAGLKENAPKVDFIDSEYYAAWAKDAIYTVSSIKNDEGIAIMAGTEPNKFSPWMYYTREQAYVTIYRLFEMCK